jgi:DNA-binding transcriptional regulator YiaG
MTPDQIKEARHTLGLTQKALSARLGVAKRTLERWEAGDCPIPGPAVEAVSMYLQIQQITQRIDND